MRTKTPKYPIDGKRHRRRASTGSSRSHAAQTAWYSFQVSCTAHNTGWLERMVKKYGGHMPKCFYGYRFCSREGAPERKKAGPGPRKNNYAYEIFARVSGPRSLHKALRAELFRRGLR